MTLTSPIASFLNTEYSWFLHVIEVYWEQRNTLLVITNPPLTRCAAPVEDEIEAPSSVMAGMDDSAAAPQGSEEDQEHARVVAGMQRMSFSGGFPGGFGGGNSGGGGNGNGGFPPVQQHSGTCAYLFSSNSGVDSGIRAGPVVPCDKAFLSLAAHVKLSRLGCLGRKGFPCAQYDSS